MKSSDFLKKYFSSFDESLIGIKVSDSNNNPVSYENAVDGLILQLKKVQQQNKKVMMVGNGGSAAIASHQAVDYWKNGKIKSIAFNDSSLITCLSNDYSYAEVFSKAIEMFGEEGDLIYCIRCPK
jgi:D-sedoheptulose 7-phosphate isomerase